MNKGNSQYLSTIRAVILDYGEIISLPRDPSVVTWMAEAFKVTEERFLYFYGSFRHDYDRGILQPEQYWTNIAQATGVTLSAEQIAEFRKYDVAMWSRLNHEILQWAHRLRQSGYKTAVLSNMHIDMVHHVQLDGEWTKVFDKVVLSSPLGIAKPEPEIFKHCLKEVEVAPSQAMFIDDRESNVEAAVRLGLLGIYAPSPADLKETLSTIGFTPLPEV